MLTLILTQIMWFVAALLVIASLLPLIKVPFGAIRGLAFFRIQLFIVAVIMALVAVLFLDGGARILVLAELAFVAVVQTIYIVKFTPLWAKQSVSADDDLAQDQARGISLVAANVKKSNRQYDLLIDLVKEVEPDVLMAIEVDQDWIDALESGLGGQFEHWVKAPRDNGYGMCLLSRLELSETEVRDLVTDEVPSIRTRVHMRDGEEIRLYMVHPEPPVIDHDTKGRDSEIALVGLEALEDDLPAIVTGDLNDVAWSTTTRRFQRLSGLLDPRVGRGFYNTFNAFTILMRWPLDHLFHDARFRFVEMKRLPKIGSDHFPMLFRLALADDPKAASDTGSVDKDEKQDVEKMIREEKTRKRDAIGSDWEDED